jgi:hypothetical protein
VHWVRIPSGTPSYTVGSAQKTRCAREHRNIPSHPLKVNNVSIMYANKRERKIVLGRIEHTIKTLYRNSKQIFPERRSWKEAVEFHFWEHINLIFFALEDKVRSRRNYF